MKKLNKKKSKTTHTQNKQSTYNFYRTPPARAEPGKLSSVPVKRQRPIVIKGDRRCGTKAVLWVYQLYFLTNVSLKTFIN